MPEKTETLSVRITPQRREKLREWADEKGISEADAVRRMIERSIHDQKAIQEIAANEEIKQKLEDIEQEIKDIDRTWWERIFG
jgi:gas vesicle protein